MIISQKHKNTLKTVAYSMKKALGNES